VDLTVSEDQEALQEGMRAFCEGRFPMSTVRALIEVPGAVDRDRWHELAGMGVFSLRRSEDDGGAGLGWADTVLAYEELGRALVPGPLVWSQLAVELVDGVADGEAIVGGIERDDPSRLVENLEALDVLLVVDADGVCRVDPSQLDATPIEYVLDPLAPVHRVAALPDGERIAGADVAAAWREQGAVLVAAYLLGLSQGASELAVAYSREREQFDRPVGSFQAVKHLLADNVVRTEVARAATYAAGVTLDDPAVGPLERAAASAKLMAAEAALGNAKCGIQVHGGMGYTWEVDAQLYFKRAYALEPLFGSREWCADRMADLVDAGVRAL
jgi:alkylation response protein AidB-like acyl-CoA dehydrogenase